MHIYIHTCNKRAYLKLKISIFKCLYMKQNIILKLITLIKLITLFIIYYVINKKKISSTFIFIHIYLKTRT